MRIDRYYYCTLEASKLLAKSDLCFPVYSINDLRHGYNINVDTVQNYLKLRNIDINTLKNGTRNALNDGILLKYDNQYFIFYNENIENKNRINWTLFHELGHIHLKHTKDSDIEEKETNTFVAQLLMPAYSILQIKKRLHGISSSDIVNIFNVSSWAAKLRLDDINKYYSNKYEPNDYDIAIWSNTKNYILQEINDNPFIKHYQNNVNTFNTKPIAI